MSRPSPVKLPSVSVPIRTLNESDMTQLEDMYANGSGKNLVFDPVKDLAGSLHSLSVAVQALAWVDNRRGWLVHIVGQMLSALKNEPDSYHSMGFKSFSGFLQGHVVKMLGLSRTTLRDAISIYESFRTTSAEDVAAVGVLNMKLLSRITNYQQPGHQKLIEAAKTQTYRELLQVVQDTANLPAGEVERAVLVIQCTRAQKAMFKEFADDPRVRSYCQSEDWATILEMMLAEVMGEWLSEDTAG